MIHGQTSKSSEKKLSFRTRVLRYIKMSDFALTNFYKSLPFPKFSGAGFLNLRLRIIQVLIRHCSGRFLSFIGNLVTN